MSLSLVAGMRSRAKWPDEPCGDSLACFALGPTPDAGSLLVVVDGLGHGALAAEASSCALATIARQPALALDALFEQLDEDLRATRGAALALARIEGARLHYAAVGNTRALRWRNAEAVRLPSQYGIVGDGRPKRLQPVTIDLRADDVLVLFTDGLSESLHVDHMPRDWMDDPGLLCDALMAGWAGPADDAAVLVATLRERP